MKPARLARTRSQPVTRRRGRSAAWLGLATWLCGAAPLAAAAPVRVAFDGCEALEPDRVRSLVGLELDTRVDSAEAQEQDPAPAAGTHADVRCDDGFADMRVFEPGRAAPTRLRLRLTDTPPAARSRLLALTLAELIVSARLARSAPTTAASEAPPPEPAGRDRAAADDEPVRTQRPLSLWLGAGATATGKPLLWTPTGELGIAYGERLLSIASLQIESGTRASAGGDVRSTGLSLAAFAAARMSLGALSLPVGFGLRGGYQVLSGQTQPTRSGRSLTGAWLAPALCVSALVPLSDVWTVRVAAEGAWVLTPLRGTDADGLTVYTHKGPRLSLSAALALSP